MKIISKKYIRLNLYYFHKGEIYLIEPINSKIINENEWNKIINEIIKNEDKFNKNFEESKRNNNFKI